MRNVRKTKKQWWTQGRIYAIILQAIGIIFLISGNAGVWDKVVENFPVGELSGSVAMIASFVTALFSDIRGEKE